MFKKILIANRGEIAIRIMRACREMGIQSVAVYSEADKDSLHVTFADESYCIGPALAKQSYLNIPAIISAAEVSGAEAIHPGYGFLAENAQFAEICADHNIKFIGPSPDNIRMMGDKNEARRTMVKHKVPVVPGSAGVVSSEDAIRAEAAKIGYPLMIKAVAGGGGKGMRMVPEESQLIDAYRMATTEAGNAFGNADVYVERFVEEPRHIEIQILSDRHGHAIHLGERDCSVQRRHQKLIEESPSPFISAALREKMGATAVQAAKALKYEGAGTIEFLVDKNHNFYFMEMNTRIQVEHTVTETVTSIDLIKAQIRIAATGKLDIKQSDVEFKGHAIELRINAEDHTRNFCPCPGTVNLYLPPGGPGVRTDSHLYPGYRIPPNYDSMIAKLIVWAENREEAIARAERALGEFVVDGIPTTIPFHQLVLRHPEFVAGNVDTKFIEKHMAAVEVPVGG